VAPEPCLERRLRGIGLRGYATLDLARRDVGLRADLERLPFAAASFDAILCNHVLEHVGDDRAALRELARVLAPGGFAVLTVPGPDPALGFPSALARTVEDDDARSPEARLRRFGHPGHLRQYGRDFSDRLADAGLPATRFDWGAELPPSTKTRRALFPSYPIYLCRRETKGETKGTLLR
jgi:SAM-dependent methyltransferase